MFQVQQLDSPYLKMMPVLAGFLVLALLTNILIENTNQYPIILDTARYIELVKAYTGIELNMSVSEFRLITNFAIILYIGAIIYYQTKNWLITSCALLGFSVSLMLYASLLSQATVIIIALFLWTLDMMDEKNAIRNNALFLIIYFVAAYLHTFGGALVMLVYLAKVFESNLKQYAKFFAVGAYLALGLLLLLVVQFDPWKADFFYYFLLPISLGSMDYFYWYFYFGVLLIIVCSCKENIKELLIAGACFLAAIISYLYLAHLAIAIWRTLAFFELVAWIKIGKDSNNQLIQWAPLLLLLMGIERLIVGLLV